MFGEVGQCYGGFVLANIEELFFTATPKPVNGSRALNRVPFPKDDLFDV